MKRLNVGSGPWIKEGYLNIDDMSDMGEEEFRKEMDDWMKREGIECPEFICMDGNDLRKFEEEEFDEVYSNQCVGEYVTNYDELIRVLKDGGTVRFGVWGNRIGHVLLELVRRNIRIVDVELLNDFTDVGDDDEFTMMIVGRKEE